MRVFVAFDDTDTLDASRGTGKLARWFEGVLPDGCSLWAVVRQQLLVHPDIPYTSHNSSACVVVETSDVTLVPELIERAASHVEQHMLPGSNPGVCVVAEGNRALPRLMAFGRRAAIEVVSQDDARLAADGVHLSGHRGTNDGIIGAAAGVGLTAWGWAGRFIEFDHLRDYPDTVAVEVLDQAGMLVAPVDRNVASPRPDDMVATYGWLRPRLWGGQPVIPVMCAGEGRWAAIGKAPIHVDTAGS